MTHVESSLLLLLLLLLHLLLPGTVTSLTRCSVAA
jgi:hypothetical protein